MGPLKTNLSQVIEKFLKMNPGKAITLNEISALFGKAYLRTTSASVAVNGFRRTGIAPFNRYVFTDDDFAPADVSDIPLTANADEASKNDQSDVENDHLFLGNKDDIVPADVSDRPLTGNTDEGSKNMNQSADEDDQPFLGFDDVDKVPQNSAPVEKAKEAPTKPTIELNKSFSVGPYAIRPLPKIALKERKSGRKKEKSANLTSSPYRNTLRALQATKEISQLKATERVSKKRPQNKPKPRRRQKENRDAQDVLCENCGICFSSSGDGNGWDKCTKCHIWYHKSCAKTCIICPL